MVRTLWSFCRIIFTAIILLMTAATGARAQWSGGFHHGAMPGPMTGSYDGHRYDYGVAAGDTTISGTALVDLSIPMLGQYRIDVTGDAQADFYLDFGPWWYQPGSGATRPAAGAVIAVQGKVYQMAGDTPILVVSQIDGKEWKAFNNGVHWSGDWVQRMHQGFQMVYDPTDSLNYVSFMGDFIRMGMMGYTSADSFYCDFGTLPGGLMPGWSPDSLVHLYHFDLTSDQGQNMMYGGFGSHMGMMNFNNALTFRMHYDPAKLDSLGIGPGQMQLYHWNEADSVWVRESGYTIDTVSAMINLTTSSASSYLALLSTNVVTGIEEAADALPGKFTLEQNYPNPFNPETSIGFTLPNQGHVTIKIYDLAGREVKTLLDGDLPAGRHQVQWSGVDDQSQTVASGIYVYRVQYNKITESRKMIRVR